MIQSERTDAGNNNEEENEYSRIVPEKRLTIAFYVDPEKVRIFSFSTKSLVRTVAIVGVVAGGFMADAIVSHFVPGPQSSEGSLSAEAGNLNRTDDVPTEIEPAATIAEIQEMEAINSGETSVSILGNQVGDQIGKASEERQSSFDAKTVVSKPKVKNSPVVALASKPLTPKTSAIEINQVAKQVAKQDVDLAKPSFSTVFEKVASISASAKIFAEIDISRRARGRDTSETEISVVVKNLSTHRISGRVWAVATYSLGGNQVKIASDKRIDLDNSIAMNNRKFGVSYSAKRFTNKVLNFSIPKGSKLEDVSVFVDNGMKLAKPLVKLKKF